MVEITIHKQPRTEAVVTQRKFFKKTARGKVIKGIYPLNTIILHLQIYTWAVLRERYLRDDVGCGLPECKHCLNGKKELLPRNGDTQHPLFPNGHFLLPDTNVFLSQVNFYRSVWMGC